MRKPTVTSCVSNSTFNVSEAEVKQSSHLVRPMCVPPLCVAGLSVALLLNRWLVLQAVSSRDLNPLPVHTLDDTLSLPAPTVGRTLPKNKKKLMNTHTRTHTHTSTHANTQTNTCTHACTHTHMYAPTNTHTHTCMHARIHTHTHARTCTHTHAHTHTQSEVAKKNCRMCEIKSISVNYQCIILVHSNCRIRGT